MRWRFDGLGAHEKVNEAYGANFMKVDPGLKDPYSPHGLEQT